MEAKKVEIGVVSGVEHSPAVPATRFDTALDPMAQLYHVPLVSITVDNVVQARHELEQRQDQFVSPLFDSREGWGWTYLQAPDGTVYQLQGALPTQ